MIYVRFRYLCVINNFDTLLEPMNYKYKSCELISRSVQTNLKIINLLHISKTINYLDNVKSTVIIDLFQLSIFVFYKQHNS